MTQKRILIASSSLDAVTHGPVCEKLAEKGADFVLYETDKVLKNQQPFTIVVANDGMVTMSCNGFDISPDRVAAGWLWKVASFRNSDAESNVSKQLSMVNEITSWNNAIWTLYPETIWLNPPNRSYMADHKLLQLQLAREVGFEIPKTVVSSVWDEVTDELFGDPARDKIIVKMLRGVIADQNVVKAMYTEVLTPERLDMLRARANAFPGLYQPYIHKAREWRVTIVGERSFPVAIYTGDEAKDDWRRHQLTPAVRYAVETLPDSVIESCKAYLRRSALRYGAFDLVEEPDGRIVFLECNPNGQYGWLEEAVGIPVAAAIVDELLSLANKNSAD